MANTVFFYPLTFSLFLVILAEICSCEYFYPPSLRSSYYGSYLYRPRRYYYGYRGYGRWGRPGLDRLSSGLIKRAETFDNDVFTSLGYDKEDDSLVHRYTDEELKYIIQNILKANSEIEKRGFDRITSGFIRKRRDANKVNDKENVKYRRKRSVYLNPGSLTNSKLDAVPAESGIQNHEMDTVSEAKRVDEEFFSVHRDKKGFDRLTSGFVKKNTEFGVDDDDDINVNANIHDKQTYDGISKSDVSGNQTAQVDKNTVTDTKQPQDSDLDFRTEKDNEKRRVDRITSGFVKKQADKRRGFDRLTSGFVKKDSDKRSFDRLTSGFVKKDGDKRNFDRLTSGFVKRRGFDRLTSGFVKKSDDINDDEGRDEELETSVENKRRFDRLTSGFVKKDDDKRYIGRVNSGFVKKENDKRRLDRLTSGFVKKDLDKRRFDRLTSGFVKKNDDKRRFDRLTSGFVKKDADKRYFGRLNSGLVKKEDDKRRFDRLTSGFVKKTDEEADKENSNNEPDVYDKDLEEDIEKMGGYFVGLNDNTLIRDSHMISSDDQLQTAGQNDKRRLDRVAYGFIKRGDESSEIVPAIGAAQSGLQKRYFDRLTSGFVKRSDLHDQNFEKRRLDRLYSGFVKRPYSENSYFDRINYFPGEQIENGASGLNPIDSDVSDILGQYDSREINLSKAPINRKKRSIYGYERGMFPVTGNEFTHGNGFYSDEDDDATEHMVNELQKRRLDRLMSGFVKKGLKFNSNDNIYDGLRDHLYNQRQMLPSTDSENYYLL